MSAATSAEAGGVAVRATSAEREALISLIEASPKAELHLHIEGTLEPELIFALAQRNGVSLPYASVEVLRQAYAFTDLQSFLDLYYAAASVLIHEQDFHDLAWAYLQRAAADGIVCAEIFFDPQTHTARGIDIGTVIRGLRSACDRAKQDLDLHAELILCVLRHLSENEGLQTLESALPYREHFIGLGLDSSERGHPPEKFERLYRRAHELGLHSEAQHRCLELLLVDRPIAILITVPEELNRLQIGLLERCLELMGDLPGSLLDALRLRRGLVRRRGRFRLDPFVRSAHGRRRSRRCVCGRGGRRGCSGREGRMLKQ